MNKGRITWFWRRAKRQMSDWLGIAARRKVRRLDAYCGDMLQIAQPALLERNSRKPAIAFTPHLKGKGFYCGEHPAARQALPGIEWVGKEDSPDYCFMWGFRSWERNYRTVALASRTGAALVTCEDGFLRSADAWVNVAAPMRYRQSASVIYDAEGFFYDASRPSTIERLLNDPSVQLDDSQRSEARRLMNRIAAAKLTKYNHQPVFRPEVGRKGFRKVLVVDQSYGDAAIRKGWGNEQTFADMLADAKRDNPGCDILVKTHPDVMTGRRMGYYDKVADDGNVFRVTMPVNPWSLLEIVDKVYVCSTQLGFEALMAGKEVHVYGMPFYAGWGLTIDQQKNPRRTNRRTLEEVFYMFYVMYTHWVDIDTGNPCTIDKAIDNLLALRDEYARLRSVQN